MGDTTASEGAGPGRMDRSALVAELNALTDSDAPAAVATPVSPADDHPIGDGDSPNDGEPAAGVEEAEVVETEAAPAPAKVDPETQKRLAAVQKQEERARKQLAAERAELDKHKAAIDAERAEFERFKAAQKRAKYDPAGVLAELGLTDDDMEPAARSLYARTKAAAADPKTRAAAEAAAREREHADELAATKKRLADLEGRIESQSQQAENTRRANAWLDDVTKAISDEAPLLKQALSKSPEKTRHALGELAVAIYQETGEAPDAADLHVAWEKRRVAELDELGLDVSTLLKKPAPAQVAAATAKPKTLGAVGTTTTPPGEKPQLSPGEQRAALIRELEQLDKASA